MYVYDDVYVKLFKYAFSLVLGRTVATFGPSPFRNSDPKRVQARLNSQGPASLTWLSFVELVAEIELCFAWRYAISSIFENF